MLLVLLVLLLLVLLLIHDLVDLVLVELLLEFDLVVEAVYLALEFLESELFHLDLGGEALVGGHELSVVFEEGFLLAFELLDVGLEVEDLLVVLALHGLHFVD